jgi:hypothetical protein
MDTKLRALRRAHEDRMKARTRRVMRLWAGRQTGTSDPRDVGVNVSTHCRPCDCWMCQSDPKEIPRLRERAFDHPDMP